MAHCNVQCVNVCLRVKIIYKTRLTPAAQVQIEGDFLPCSFSILEDQPMDMLLGLDMLKRHQVRASRRRVKWRLLPPVVH